MMMRIWLYPEPRELCIVVLFATMNIDKSNHCSETRDGTLNGRSETYDQNEEFFDTTRNATGVDDKDYITFT